MSENEVIVPTKDNKTCKGLLLLVLGILIVLLGGLLLLVYLSKDGKEGKHFSKDKYYVCNPSTDLDGPMTYYVKYDTKGRYINILASPQLYESAGKYEIDENKIVMDEEFSKTYQFPASKQSEKYEYEYKDGNVITEGYKCKSISASEFKSKTEIFSHMTYDEMKKSYEDAKNDPDASYRKYEDLDNNGEETPTTTPEKETLDGFGLKDATIVSKNHSFMISYKADYYDDTTIGTIDVTIKTEKDKEIVSGNCYSLSNETISRFKINNNDTIDILRSGEGDDPSDFYIDTYNYNGNKTATKKITREEIDTNFTKENTVYYYDGNFN